MNENFERLLDRLYRIEKNYDGVDGLYRKAKKQDVNIDKKYVSKWLKEQSTHQQNAYEKPAGGIELKPIYSEDIYSFQIDLTFLPKYEVKNDGNYVLFTAININTRYAYASYGKDKETSTILRMLNDFLEDCLEIHNLTLDSGSEFTNKTIINWFNSHDITTFFVVGDSHKLGIINRFHRTLKGKINKWMTDTDDVRWTKVLTTIIKNYNNTFNSGIGYTPREASKGIITSRIINKAIIKTDEINSRDKQVFNVGDKCRVFKDKSLFDKMQTNFSEIVYTIIKVNKNTVNIEDATHEYENIKKKYVMVVKDVKNHQPNIEKKGVEVYAKVKRALKRLEHNENIINGPRVGRGQNRHNN